MKKGISGIILGIMLTIYLLLVIGDNLNYYDFIEYFSNLHFITWIGYASLILLVVLAFMRKDKFAKFVFVVPAILYIIQIIMYGYDLSIIIELFFKAILPYLLVLILSLISKHKVIRKLWFIPPVIYLIAGYKNFPLWYIEVFEYYIEEFELFIRYCTYLITDLIDLAVFFLASYWLIVSPHKVRKTASNINKNINYNSQPIYQNINTDPTYGYMDMSLHVLLLLLTCGIYLLVWVYKTTTYAYKDDSKSAINLLLFMFIPFYSIYWFYQISKLIDEEGYKKGIKSEICTICTILAIVCPIIAPLLIQNKINTLVEMNMGKNMNYSQTNYSDTYSSNNNANPNPSQETKRNIPEEIKAYKELLDEGAITKEEYEQKKKELLKLK